MEIVRDFKKLCQVGIIISWTLYSVIVFENRIPICIKRGRFVRERFQSVEMHCPERYIKNNGIQQREAKDALTAYIEKMAWTSNETVLDIGCGPGDVTSDILYPFLKNKIKVLVCI